MHVENNVCESIREQCCTVESQKMGLMLARIYKICKFGRTCIHNLVEAEHTFHQLHGHSQSVKKNICKKLYDFKGLDGYCSNIGKCVSLEKCKVTGLKSHDFHVLVQQLLPVALRGFLPKGTRKAILRLCAFFNKLCQCVIDREKIAILEEEVLETLCMLERFFPPSFFDIMVHLTVHLGREARLCEPVHFR